MCWKMKIAIQADAEQFILNPSNTAAQSSKGGMKKASLRKRSPVAVRFTDLTFRKIGFLRVSLRSGFNLSTPLHGAERDESIL